MRFKKFHIKLKISNVLKSFESFVVKKGTFYQNFIYNFLRLAVFLQKSKVL